MSESIEKKAAAASNCGNEELNAAEAAKAQNQEQQEKPARQGTRRAGDNFLDVIYKFETSYPGGLTADTLFDERTERIVVGHADKLVGTGLFPQHEREDIQQIMRLALMHEMSNYDPSRDRYVFAANVCANYGKNLITKRAQERALTNGAVMSLDVEAGDGETFAELVRGEEPSPLEAAIHSDFAERLMAALPETDRKICKLLMLGYTLREISVELELCLSVVHKHVAGHIRREAARIRGEEVQA